MEIEEGVKRLRDMIPMSGEDADNEVIHGEADDILLEFVPFEIRKAYDELTDKVRFWYA